MKELFGKCPGGETAYLYTLKNRNGMEMKITNYGGIVHSISVPDKDGNFEDILLGYKDLDGYLQPKNPYFNCLVGRVGNRIANGKFVLDGTEYTLAQNDGKNHLHGGLKGFDKRVWEVTEVQSSEGACLELTYTSADGEEGYPGKVSVLVRYTLTDNNEFKIYYLANVDKPTPVNLTQHVYFNLTGNCKKNVLDHQVKINASGITEIDETLIPTGKIMNVEGTAFDFRQMKTIGRDIHNTGGGYDHNFVLDGKGLRKVAEVIEPQTKRKLEVFTTSIGVQLYTGNFLDGGYVGKKGVAYEKHDGFCLETQYFPDSPNIPAFPSVIFRPGSKFEHETIYQFSVAK